MTGRRVNIDDELLAEATAVFVATTVNETVNRALREVLAASKRRRHADRLAHMDGLDLHRPKLMSAAWGGEPG